MIRKAEIMKSAKVLKSNMFLVKKYLADGSFDKVKARLVSLGWCNWKLMADCHIWVWK